MGRIQDTNPDQGVLYFVIVNVFTVNGVQAPSRTGTSICSTAIHSSSVTGVVPGTALISSSLTATDCQLHISGLFVFLG